MTAPKWVYAFGDGKADGHAGDRNLLGGKGAGLAEMCNLGLPVPSGFTVTTEVCTYYYANNQTYPAELTTGRAGLGANRAERRREIRRCAEPAAGFGAFRRARLDAGDDGHRPQSRSQ